MIQRFVILNMTVAFLGAMPIFPSNAADDRQPEIDAAIRRVRAGDMTVITDASKAKDFHLLYELLWTTSTNRTEPTAEARGAELARCALIAIPGHAKYLADQIGAMSNIKGTNQQREKCFSLLGRLGSSEAIQQAGRLLADERNPEADKNSIYNDGVFYQTNGGMAWGALENLVLDELDLPAELKRQYKMGNFGLGMQVSAATHAWWESDKSLPYRLAANANAKPAPSVTPIPDEAPHLPGTPQSHKLVTPTLKEEEGTFKAWILGTLLVAVSASLILLVVRRSKL